MQTICTLLQTDNHINTSSFNFYSPDALPGAQQCQRLKALKATALKAILNINQGKLQCDITATETVSK